VYCPECGHHNRESARFCGRCGASLIELTEGEATVSFTPPAEPGADSGVMEAVVEGATLVIRLGGGRAGDQFPVGPSITSIGRAPESDVFLDDVTVSREHAVLEQRQDGIAREGGNGDRVKATVETHGRPRPLLRRRVARLAPRRDDRRSPGGRSFLTESAQG